jgi:chromate transporter
LIEKNIYYKLFWIFFKISSITLGGGYAMVPVYREYVVRTYNLMDDETFLNLLAQAQSVPGPIAVNMALLVGRELAGMKGAVVSSFSVIIPPFTVILIVSVFFSNIIKYKVVRYFLQGVNIGITAVLINMVFDFSKKYFKRPIIIFFIFFTAILIAFFKFQAVTLFLIFAILIFVFDKRKYD